MMTTDTATETQTATEPTKATKGPAFSASAKVLGAALNLLAGAVSKRSIYVLQGVYVETTDAGLRLRATSLDQTLITHCPALIERPGTAVILHKQLSAFCAVIERDTMLHCTVSDLKASVTTKGAKAALECYNPDDFPTEPTVSDVALTLPAASLLPALAAVLPAVAKDELRPVLECALLDVHPDGITVVGVDGYRLHRVTLPLMNDAAPVKLLVPRAAVELLVKVLDPQGEPVTLCRAGVLQTAFRQGETCLIANQMEGVFPNYQRIMPARAERVFTATVGAWQQALRVASVFATGGREGDAASILTLTVPAGAGRMEATLKMEAEATLVVEATAGQRKDGQPDDLASEIRLNYRYLGDLLSMLPAAVKLDCWFNDPRSPLLCAPQDKQALDCVGVLMPMFRKGGR